MTVPETGDLTAAGRSSQSCLFQSVREFLINSSKHAGTGEAAVRLEWRDGLLRIEVSDEGAGFDFAAAAALGHRMEASLPNSDCSVSENACGRSGARFELKSSPGKGTTAILMLPLLQSC